MVRSVNQPECRPQYNLVSSYLYQCFLGLGKFPSLFFTLQWVICLSKNITFVPMGRILAIDYGKKRVGLAVTDPLRIIAQPLQTVPASDCLDYLEKYFAQNSVDIVVIGMPVQPNGAPSESQRYIIPFMHRFRHRFPLMELVTADERYTSLIAHRAMIEGGVKQSDRRESAGIVDKTAAAIILQGYLETI